jgi:hypothetical protein
MLEKPPVDRFLIDAVMNRGIVEHYHGHQTGRAFLRDLIRKQNDSGAFDGCLARFVIEEVLHLNQMHRGPSVCNAAGERHGVAGR